jgi:hypothetical protein
VKTGIFPNMSMQEYLDLPALSAGAARLIVDDCPYAAWFDSALNPNRVPDDTDASDAGTIAHGILLEGNTSRVAVINPEDHPAKTTGAIPKGWTNDSIKAARDAARASGLVPMLPWDMAEIHAMNAAATTYIASLYATERRIPEMFAQDGGLSELVMVWDDGGILCKLRIDRTSHDYKTIVDYKTSQMSVEPSRWGRAALHGRGLYFNAAWYRRGVEALVDVVPEYLFLVQGQARPFLCSMIGCDAATIALGNAKVTRALALWRRCVETGVWPAYPQRVVYPEAPPWEMARFEEQELEEPFP